MVEIVQSHQFPLRKFSDVQQAADALHALEEQGFDAERLAIVPESLQSRPNIQETEAANSAGAGAIVGTVLGVMVGLLLASFNLSSTASLDMAPLAEILSITSLASGVGAAGGAVITAITGGSVNKHAVQSGAGETENYLLVVDNTTPEEVQKAQNVLQQLKGGIPA